MSDGEAGTTCPACGEQLPLGARYCGGCGSPLAARPVGTAICPLCRTEVPAHARFCGACGQPLGTSPAIFLDPDLSPLGRSKRVRLPLESTEAPESPPVVPLPPPQDETPAVRGRREAGIGGAKPGAVAQVVRTGSQRAAQSAEPAVDVDAELEIREEETVLRLAEANRSAMGGDFERAARVLVEPYGPWVADPRVQERLEYFATAIGQRLAERGRRGEMSAAALRLELRRLLRLVPDRGWQRALRREIAPAATADDVRRVRDLLAEGHIPAAMALVEKVLAVGYDVLELRILRRDVVAALVLEAAKLEQSGNEALRRGDARKAAICYESALALLENDRILLARLEEARRCQGGTAQ